MSITAVNSNTNASIAQLSSLRQQRHQDFQAVAQSLQSGDLAGAQRAFATFQQDIRNSGQGMNNLNALPMSGQNLPALQRGSVGSSNQAFAALMQQMQSMQGSPSGPGNTASGLIQALSGNSASATTTPQDLLSSLLQPSSGQNQSGNPTDLLQSLGSSGTISSPGMMASLLQQAQNGQQLGANALSGINPANQRQQQFQNLAQALASGNLIAAQQAMAILQQSAPNGQNRSDPETTIQNDMQTVRRALDANDVAGAKSAMAALTKNLQAAQAYRNHSHGHHGHHGGQVRDSAGGSPALGLATTTDTTPASSLAASLSSINTLA